MFLKKSNWVIVLAGLFLWCLVGGVLYFVLNTRAISLCTDDEVVEINRIEQESARHWTHPEELDQQEFLFGFTLLDSDGQWLYSYGDADSRSVADGIRNGDIVLNRSNTILININREERTKQFMRQMGLFFWLLTGTMILAAVCGCLYISHKILDPFRQMKSFAASIASGNLDIPLTMGKKQYFGAYTESFDLMREELYKAREQEYQANVSKKELVATLSHDIKTPVTSIKLMCEVLSAKLEQKKTVPEELAEKISSIYAKAGQIDTLVSDMFQSTLEDLGELRIQIEEEASGCIEEMVRRSDFREKIEEYDTPPQCLLSIDRLRLEQVIGNIINNSYKYADTRITVSYMLTDDFLQISIRDFGKGVEEEELPHIFRKFYRGKNALAVQQSGAGLGLYICESLMEKMGGSISGVNRNPGFEVYILAPLV